MEGISNIIIYLILPLFGLLVLIGSIFNIIKVGSLKSIGTFGIVLGLILILIPFKIYYGLKKEFNNYYNDVPGYYCLTDNTEVVLTIREDSTFKMEKIEGLKTSGEGLWEFHSSESYTPMVTLFIKNYKYTFEIINDGGKTKLHYDTFWNKDSLKLDFWERQ